MTFPKYLTISSIILATTSTVHAEVEPDSSAETTAPRFQLPDTEAATDNTTQNSADAAPSFIIPDAENETDSTEDVQSFTIPDAEDEKDETAS